MFTSSRKITSAVNRFKLIYVQIKHDRCRFGFVSTSYNTHFNKRREVKSLLLASLCEKGEKKSFKYEFQNILQK